MADEIIIQDGSVIVTDPDDSSGSVIVPGGEVIIVGDGDAGGADVIVVDDVDPSVIDVDTTKTHVYEGGDRNDTTVLLVAGEALAIGDLVYTQGGKCFRMQTSGEAYYGRKVGFAITAALPDTPVRVQFSGITGRSGWGLTQDKIYFATANGAITDTLAVADKLVLPVGAALSADRLIIHFGTSYVRR